MATDADFLSQLGLCTADSVANQLVYSDWLKEQGQESLGAIVAKLDDLIGAALLRNLTIEVREMRHTPPNSYRDILTGLTIEIRWKGITISMRNIGLQ